MSAPKENVDKTDIKREKEKTETNDENTNETETKDKILEIHNIFERLFNLHEIVSRGYNIQVDYSNVNISNYGPKEFMPRIVEKERQYYKVITIGDMKQPYLKLEPLLTDTFTNIEEFLLYNLKIFELVLDLGKDILKEPPKLITSRGMLYDSNYQGVPLSELEIALNRSIDLVNYFATFSKPQDTDVTVTEVKKVNCLMPESIGVLRNTYFRLLLKSKDDIRNRFIVQYERTLDYSALPKVPKVLTPGIYLAPIVSPFNLNSIFSLMPLGVELSYLFICKLLRPRITLTPVPQSVILTNTCSNIFKSSVMTNLNNVGMSHNWDAMLFSYFSCFLYPGIVIFDIDFEDFKDTDGTMFIICLMCKLLFMWNDEIRWTNLNYESRLQIDVTIIRFLENEGLIRRINPNQDRIAGDYNQYAPNGRYKGDHYNFLKTQSNGMGWMNAGKKILKDDISIYPNCATRQLFFNDRDNTRMDESNHVTPDIMSNTTYAAINEILNALQSKPAYRELSAYFAICTTRIYEFFSSFNEYNRLNWYTGLRISDREYTKKEIMRNSMKTMTISLKCISYMFKCMCKHDPMEND